MRFDVFPGGNIKKSYTDSTVASGLNPFQRIGYAGHIVRNQFSLQNVFDGGHEEWRMFLREDTVGGKGLAIGDSLRLAIADPTVVFQGSILQLKKDLPSNIGLKLEIVSNAMDPSKDSFVSVSQVIPAGSKAGDVYIPPHYSSEDFSVGGLSLIVTLTGKDQEGTIVDVSGLCFGIRLEVRDLFIEHKCSCVAPTCPAYYPPEECFGDMSDIYGNMIAPPAPPPVQPKDNSNTSGGPQKKGQSLDVGAANT